MSWNAAVFNKLHSIMPSLGEWQQNYRIVGWLVGCFGFNGPLRQYFSLYRAVSQREGEREERIDESKNVQTTPTRTYCKRNRPLPYCNQNCRTPRHWKLTQHHYRIDRKGEVTLARLRIGHTFITHSFLLKGEDWPLCIPCQEPFSVKHFLLDCTVFRIIRSRFYRVNSLKELFDTVEPVRIFSFLKEIGLYDKI